VPDLEWALLTDRVRAMQRGGEYGQALADAAELEAEHPGAHVGPWNLRDGTTGLTASWHGSTVAGETGEVREWLAGQPPAP
jgi:hypothetical protein